MIKMTFPLALNCRLVLQLLEYTASNHIILQDSWKLDPGAYIILNLQTSRPCYETCSINLWIKKKKKVNMINPENLTWEPLMKVHLSNERDCSATSVIYEFELNYDAVTNKTNILEATNFGERFISGSCLGPCRWAMLASISSSPWDEGRTSTPN